jgi:hypothetical protein
VPQERADPAVRRAIERDVLDPQLVEATHLLAVEQLTPTEAATTDRPDHFKWVRIEAEPAHYADAVANAGLLDTIVQASKVREERRHAIRAERRTLVPAKPGELDAAKIRATLG